VAAAGLQARWGGGDVAVTAGVLRGYQLQVGPPDVLAVSVVMFPQVTVLAQLRGLAPGPLNGGPGLLPATIDKALSPAARFAARSFAARGPSVIPECCAPIPPLADVPVAEQAARLRDLDPGVLTGELAASARANAAPGWQAAAREPRRWLASMADASLDTWAVLQPRWQAAAPLLDREVARVGIAAVRGGMEALLNSLHPRISYADGVLTAAFPLDRRVALAGRRLALLPMIARRDQLFVSFDRPDVCYLAYPICPPPRPGAHADADGALALILGPLRAAALRALRQPLTVSELAAAVQCAPTTATYHLNQLAAAGLISRERQGTSIRISRTARGDNLVGLMSD
jgi:DNA-binding transcriptional ArsR family regulator